jgi:hypothetical protein
MGPGPSDPLDKFGATHDVVTSPSVQTAPSQGRRTSCAMPSWGRSSRSLGLRQAASSDSARKCLVRGLECRAPLAATTHGMWRSLVSAPALGAGGRRFESGHPDHGHRDRARSLFGFQRSDLVGSGDAERHPEIGARYSTRQVIATPSGYEPTATVATTASVEVWITLTVPESPLVT